MLKRKFPVWVTLLSNIMIFLIGVIPNWYPMIKEYLSKPFVVNIENNWFPEKETYISSVACINGNKSSRNIHLVLALRITNISSKPLGISYYFLEAKMPDSDWIYIENVGLFEPNHFHVDQFYQTPSGVAHNYFDFSENIFDIVAREKLLQPGESISGWAFFTTAMSVVREAIGRKDTKYRLVIYDTEGHKTYIDLITLPSLSWFKMKPIADPLANCTSDSSSESSEWKPSVKDPQYKW